MQLPEPSDRGSNRKTRTIDYAKKYWWSGAIAVPVIVAGIGLIPSLLDKESSSGISVSLSRDSHDVNFQQINVVEREYREKTGEALPPEVRKQIEQALQMLQQKRYDDGIPLLREAAGKVQVPSLLADLGTALALAGKGAEAESVYSQAASADPSNELVAQGRQLLANFTGNNTVLTAAAIPMGTAVYSTLLDNDADFFKFRTPAGPRDYMRVTLRNRSTTLGTYVGARDAAKAPIGETSGAAGADVTYLFPSTPNSEHYIEVKPHYSGGGAYSLTVEPTRSFDEWEANDTILTAREIEAGGTIEANIMDAQDQDFYKFRARAAKTSITVDNRSGTLGVRVAASDGDKAPIGEAAGSAGANVRYEFETKPGDTYHLQIAPNYSGGGAYALTVK